MPIAQLIMFSDTSCPSFSRDLSNNCVDEKDAVSAYDGITFRCRSTCQSPFSQKMLSYHSLKLVVYVASALLATVAHGTYLPASIAAGSTTSYGETVPSTGTTLAVVTMLPATIQLCFRPRGFCLRER